MLAGNQDKTRAFLADAMAGQGGGEEIETHISHIFVGGEVAWKLKRAVRLPYADFSTVERRLACCQREVELNRRTAPSHYLGVRSITLGPDGLAFDGPGELVDAVVEMRAFDQASLLDRLAVRGELTPQLVERLATAIARLHDNCPPDHRPGSERVAEVLAVNEASLAETRVFPRDEVEHLNTAFRAAAATWRTELDARAEAGRVRLAHGDLHLRNIFLNGDEPVIFDCIEFNDALATIDLLYDLAFLLMDLLHRGLPGLANLVLNRYLDQTGDEGGMSLVPFFMALRAAVRAHVTATAINEGADTPARRAEARAYFDLALRLLQTQPTVVVAVGGLSGSGKSTVAQILAAQIGGGAGARYLSSDRQRKALHGVAPETRLPLGAYSPEASEQVYRAITERAQGLAAGGVSVVADAVFARPAERMRIATAAEAGGVSFHGFWLDAPAELLRERVASRRGGPSDATLTVLEAQLSHDLGQIAWTRLDAASRPEVLAEQIAAVVRTPSGNCAEHLHGSDPG
ncbi:MAG: AAA family ATPase [Rubellimicrobium sp.]|nr:AAA family ATPase [Rubellimicrobium sp.]